MTPATGTLANPASGQTAPTVVYEDYKVVFDVKAYIRDLKLTKKDISHNLHISGPQLDQYCAQGWMPRCVWRKALSQWGRGEAKDIRKEKGQRRLRVDARLAEYVGAKTLEQEVKLTTPKIEPPPPPPTVPYDLYQSTLMLMMHQNSALLAEKAIIEADNTRLYKVIALLRADAGFEQTVNAVGFTDRQVPLSLEPSPQTRDQIVEEMRKLSSLNGNGAVLSDLAKRLPFVRASLS